VIEFLAYTFNITYQSFLNTAAKVFLPSPV